MEYNTFRLNRRGQKIEFECSKTWILDKVESYIELIIDATNYRNTIRRVVKTGDEFIDMEDDGE